MKKTLIQEYLDILDCQNFPETIEKYLLAPSLIRLKNIGYFCGMDYASKDIYKFTEKISRYDHSLSVALITWKLTGDIKQTLAGLFHDVSTPCFSHVIDYMNKDYEKQESTEEKTEEILKNDFYLLKCLETDGILVDDIINFKKYSIVDLDRPMLCADRLDGVILTGLGWTKNITIEDAKQIISDLIIYANERNQKEIGFKTKEIAQLVLRTSKLIDVYCHSKEDNYMMELLAKITKRAINLEIVTYDQLFELNEEEMLTIFEKSNDKELQDNFKKFRNISISQIPHIDMPPIKIRDLHPIVLNHRLK